MQGGAIVQPLKTYKATRRKIVVKKQKAQPFLTEPFNMAEGGGFEPPVACTTTDFESVTFGRSDTPPWVFRLGEPL